MVSLYSMRRQADAVVMVTAGAEEGNAAVGLNDDSGSDPAVAPNCSNSLNPKP